MQNLQQVAAHYHEHDKLLVFHADADLTGLEELILDVGYDIAEWLERAAQGNALNSLNQASVRHRAEEDLAAVRQVLSSLRAVQ